MRLLVGDIGGTKTALGMAETDGGAVTLSEPRRYPSAGFGSFDQIVQHYMVETGAQCRFAAFAVAGPIHDRRCETTNLPWLLDADALEHGFGFAGVELLNDLEAVAWGVPVLEPRDLAEIHPGDALSQGNACVVAAGTGLGQAGLFWDGIRHQAFATEGGHTDFAPADDLEFALLTYLKSRYGRVSWERVVSGPGIANLYDFLLFRHGVQPPAWLKSAIDEGGDTAAAVAQAAADERCPLCVETMGLFMRLYGREAGNLALKHMALGGVYLGGGIALKNLTCLRRGGFLEGFFDKGRMGSLMRRMPVRVIMQPHTPLLGAARFMASQ
ncbi:glucokinase [Thiocystis violacea]|uniref:glucokinase n=1 Tax=Thiocystis violacea TaxID=13725 RepID=UPI001906F9A9|nr:glucokinase [Thiocystis violacea]MBK1717712.1 glucokinase [Thiocystis violacea]